MALSEAQEKFIQTYVADLGKFRSRKAKSQYKDFARRYNDTEAALKILPEGHATRTLLGAQLKNANTRAENGEFKAAYKDLKEVKAAAKLAANGYIDLITPGALKAEIDHLETMFQDHKHDIDQAFRRLDAFQASLDRYPVAGDKADLREATLFRKAFDNYETLFNSDFEGRIDLLKQRSADAGADDMPDFVARLKRKFKIAEDAGKMGEISEQVARVVTIDNLLNSKDGIYANVYKGVAKHVATYKDAYDARIREIKSMDNFKTDDTWGSIKMEEVLSMFDRDDKEIELMFKDTEGFDLPDSATLTHAMETDSEGLKQSVYLRLMKEEEARVERARERWLLAKEMDEALTDGTGTGRTYEPAVPEELDQFGSDAVLGDVFDDLPDKIDNMVIMQKIDAMNTALKDHLADLDDPPDYGCDEAVLDLMLMTEEDMFASLARAAGVPEVPSDCTEDHRALLEQMAKEAVKTVRENAPNKMAADNSTITLGDAVFDLDKYLGGGANGSARRFKDPTTGESLIVKSLNIGRDSSAMVKEMRTHARLQKGDTEQSKDHIAELKGAAIGPDGTLHMIMVDAGGNDMQDTTNAMKLMDEVGAMPPEARTALTQDLVRQTIDGLKYLEEKNAIHNDLKPENIIIDSSGKVKIIDFGESQFADAEGKEAGASVGGYGTTKVFEAPEQWETKQTEVTKGVDTFAIGGILKALGGEYGETALGEDFTPNFEGNTTPFRAEEDIKTGLDRVGGATMAPKAEDRPSLDAIAASSFLSTSEDVRDYVPGDVEDLKEAAMAYQEMLANVKVTVAANQIDGLSAGDKSLVDIQSNLSKAEAYLINTRDFLKRADAKGETVSDSRRSALGKLEVKIAALQKVRNDAISAAREEGEAAYNELLNDEDKKITFGAKDITIKAALALQEKERMETSKLRGAFYRRERKHQKDKDAIIERLVDADTDDKPGIQKELRTLEDGFKETIETVNAAMKQHQDNVNEINALIESRLEDSLTDAAKFHLADMKLREVGSRFGRGVDASQSTSKAEASEEEAEAAEDEKDEIVN